MPGKYLEFIKAGRYVVPVEINFLQATIIDGVTRKETVSSKWIERHHWKEIKAILKPAVEAALKYNEQPIEKLSKGTHISFGHEIGLGYTLGANKDKSPFVAILDVKKNCWTDDEDEETDENSQLRDLGGHFKNFTPTKIYISCAILRKTSSTTDDNKRLRKELGTISEDVRSYFQSANSVVQSIGIDTTPISTVDKVNFLLGLSDKSRDRKASVMNEAPKDHVKDNSSSTTNKNITEDSTNSYYTKSTGTGLDSLNSFSVNRKKTGEDHYDEEIRKWRYERKTIPNKNDSFWSNINVEGSYYEERDDDGDIDSEDNDGKIHHHHTNNQDHSNQDLYNLDFLDDDDTFSLPDIDTPIKVSASSVNSQNTEIIRPEENIIKTFNSYNRTSPHLKKTSKLDKKKSPKKKTNHSIRCRSSASSEEDSILNNGLSDLLLENLKSSASAKKKRKRTNSFKNHNFSTRESYSNSAGDVNFEEAIRAFEFRNIETSSLTSVAPEVTTSIKQSYSPEKKKPKDHHYPIVSGFKKSPTMSPTRSAHKPKSPTPLNIGSPLRGNSSSKPSSSSKQSRLSESSPVSRKLFPASCVRSDNNSLTSYSTSTSSLQKEPHNSEVQIVGIKPKRVRRGRPPAESHRSSSPSGKSTLELTKVKKEKGLRKDSDQHSKEPVCIHIDPEMPVLERMVEVQPCIPVIPTTKFLKVEHLSPCKASSQILQTPVLKRRRRKKLKKAKQIVNKAAARSVQRNDITQPIVIVKRKRGRPRKYPLPSIGKPKYMLSSTGDGGQNNTAVVPKSSIKSLDPSGTNLGSSEPSSHLSGNKSTTEGKSNHLTTAPKVIENSVDNDLFSFENLDKSPPKFTVPSGLGVAASTSVSSANEGDSAKNHEPRSIMPPPTKRPPRTPKKIHPVIPIAVRPQINHINGPSTSTELVRRPQSTTVGVQVNPSQLTTYELLSNPNLLRAGMGLLTKFAANKINPREVDSKIGITEAGVSRMKRSASPDICVGPLPKSQKELDAELMPAPKVLTILAQPTQRAASSETNTERSIAISDFNTGSCTEIAVRSDSTEDLYMSDTDAQDGGEALVRELMTRYNNRDHTLYEPEGDEFDLSQRSYCMLNVVSDYQQKSRLYKIHSKRISGLSVQELIQHFRAVLAEVADVFKGSISSERHTMYLYGQAGRKHLKDMNVCVPFTNEHGMTLITLLFEYFVPDVSKRLHWTDYVNFVLLPEAFIRIYAHVNDLVYSMAETEMRYGACYDDPTQVS